MKKRMSQDLISNSHYNMRKKSYINIDFNCELHDYSSGSTSSTGKKRNQSDNGGQYKFALLDYYESQIDNKKAAGKKKPAVKFNTKQNNYQKREKSSSQMKYKFMYGTAFLGIFGIMFFWSINISSAGNIKNQEPDYKNYVSFEEYPERHLEELIFADEITPEKATKNNTVNKIKKLEYSNYRVKSNETLDDVAKKFGLYKDTLILVNNMKKHKNLIAGDILQVPNQDGREIKVVKNDSIYKIASRYGCNWEDIADINNLNSERLLIGQKLFIPNSRMTKYEKDQYYGDYYIWPVMSKVITSDFGPRTDPINKKDSFHAGLDIRSSMGEDVKVIKDGKVINTGVSKILGNYIEVRHDNNLVTKYGHLSKILVKKNDYVNQGDVIGLTGSTGRSTGPHLHLEARKNGKLINPLKLM